MSALGSVRGLEPHPRTYFPYGNFRRRIRLVATRPDVVEGGLEDDMHYFIVRLRHDEERILDVDARSVRAPWATCPEAAMPLRALIGMPLEPRCTAVGEWTDATANCTHQFDLAGLAAAHAYRAVGGGDLRRQYDAIVPFGVASDEEHTVTLERDGTEVLRWQIRRNEIVAPEPYCDVPFTGGFMRWAYTTLASDEAEAAVVLRRACTIGRGRGMDLDGYVRLTEIPQMRGVCYSAQPERAQVALRNRGVTRDFDTSPDSMLAEGPA